jgi:endoglucanase
MPQCLFQPRRGGLSLPRWRRPAGWYLHRLPWRFSRVLLAVAWLAVAAAITIKIALGLVGLPQHYASPLAAGTRFYVNPDNPAALWVRANPGDRMAPLIERRIARRPQAVWITTPDPAAALQQVRAVVSPAGAVAEVPVLVAYAIPHRDCSGASPGGAADLATYRVWADAFGQGLGHARAVVVLEPDALALMSCLTPRQSRDRFTALSYAARTIHRHDPAALIYYDAGNSAWQPPGTMAARLKRAGISRSGNGIALNVSNYDSTSSEIRYGTAILSRLASPRLRMVIDTSRNGAGPAPDHGYCDPRGRRLGTPPTADPGPRRVAAYLWIKQPGEADGCLAAPGTFVPSVAYQLAR